MTTDEYQFRYAAWRFMLWTKGVPGLATYDDIDRAVREGRVKPGWMPSPPAPAA